MALLNLNTTTLLQGSSIPFEAYEPGYNAFIRNAIISKVDLGLSFNGNPRDRFMALSEDAKQLVMDRLETINQILESSVHTLGTHEGHFFLRGTLHRLGWKVSQDVFEIIGKEDTVEIYGLDLSLKMFNMRFMQLCSYSLEDVLTREFFEIFSRDQAITAKIIEQWGLLRTRHINISTDLGPDHVVDEASSFKKKRFWVHSKALAPVFGLDRTIIGGMYIASVNELSRDA